MNKYGQPTFEELYKLFPELSDEQIAAIFAIFERQSILSPDEQFSPEDYGFECESCGKPMSYRYCGMCWQCEQIYNS